MSTNPTSPNATDYTAFLRGVVGVPITILPDGDPQIQGTLDVALLIVNEVLCIASPTLYTYAAYNLAADRLINFGNDPPNQTYFKDLRAGFNIFTVSTGVASNAADQGTSVGILNPIAMHNFTMQDLQTLKTPYGRQYMGLAQAYGPALWGLS